jgi:hypothetical protein
LSALRIGELPPRANAGRVRLRAGTTAKRGYRGNESRAGNNRHLKRLTVMLLFHGRMVYWVRK